MTISETLVLASLRAANPTPGPATQPPGFEDFGTILGWAKWICLAVLVAGLMAAGARTALGGRHGDGAEHAGRVGAILIGTIIVSGAGAIVGFLA